MITDEEYIQNIKRQYNRRKKAGALLLFVTVLISALTYLAYSKSNESAYLIVETLQLLHEGDIVRKKDINNIISTNNIANNLGVKTGVLLGSGCIFISIFISYALLMLFGMRKERLLIEYYERTKN